MNALTRVGAFAVTLVALTGGAAALGAAAGPFGPSSSGEHDTHPAASQGRRAHIAASPAAGPQEAVKIPAGLQVSQDGYTLDLLQDLYDHPGPTALRFRIIDEDLQSVTGFETLHGKPLHLIVVRRDLNSFQHVHPVMTADGTWSADVDLDQAGAYRVFADFRPRGAVSSYTLGRDLSVQGHSLSQALPEPAAVSVEDGYEVRLDGELVAARTSQITLTVGRAGRPVTDLEPYLGAYGHVVALRDGDLAYLHVHPNGEPGDGTTEPGPTIAFSVEVPSAGIYRLFLDYQHEGRVRTAAFTVRATTKAGQSTSSPSTPATPEPSPHSGHAH